MKEKIISILSCDGQKEHFLLESIGKLMPPPANENFHSQLLELFVHMTTEDCEAKLHWEGILKNYEQLNSKLGRDVGIRVAIVDYFLNQNKKFNSPILVEIHLFKETEKLAMLDGLTGLFNRRYFDLYVQKELKRAGRHDQDFSILLLDLDNFKQINDTRGHLFGDEVLRNLAVLLKSVTREEDVVCRYGGEEFLILLPETSMSSCMAFAERLRNTMHNDPFFHENMITMSGGIASYPYCGSHIEELLSSADQALYEAKFSGKDRFVKSVPSDQRRKLRFDYAWNLRYQPLEDKTGKLAKKNTTTKNVSLGGLCVELNEKYSIGDKLLIDIEMPNGKTSIVSEVVWLQQKSENVFCYGLEFCDLRSDQRRLMMQILPSDFYDPAGKQKKLHGEKSAANEKIQPDSLS